MRAERTGEEGERGDIRVANRSTKEDEHVDDWMGINENQKPTFWFRGVGNRA